MSLLCLFADDQPPTTREPPPLNRLATTTRILVRFRPFAYPTMMVACYLVWQLRLQP
uniref:Uncharacterized protein n=1 Tax=Helianthus annuus TaxID=4232 RepID=A0A251VLA7_HELAN